MNREILFKAKCIDGGNWTYGDLIHRLYGICIDSVDGLHELYVNKDTICQYTGLTDKDGEKIWENDIVLIHERHIDEDEGYFVVKWDNEDSQFVLVGETIETSFASIYGRDCEVAGNVFDNPGLLEVVE